jgi:hypothetical protein
MNYIESSWKLIFVVYQLQGQHEVPQNFKKLLSYSLGILVSQDKLKKVTSVVFLNARFVTSLSTFLHTPNIYMTRCSNNKPELYYMINSKITL